MTRREFNRLTQENYGAPMASDTRSDYRDERHTTDDSRAPLLERRAAYLAHFGRSPIVLGGKFRAAALWAAKESRG